MVCDENRESRPRGEMMNISIYRLRIAEDRFESGSKRLAENRPYLTIIYTSTVPTAAGGTVISAGAVSAFPSGTNAYLGRRAIFSSGLTSLSE